MTGSGIQKDLEFFYMEIEAFDDSLGKKVEEERIYFLCPTSSGK